MIDRSARAYTNVELDLVSALNLTELRASNKRLPGDDPFLIVWLADTRGRVGDGIIETSVVEVESWAGTPSDSWDQLSAARRILAGLVGTRGIRRVEEINGPSSLPTGEKGWERYRMQIEVTAPTR